MDENGANRLTIYTRQARMEGYPEMGDPYGLTNCGFWRFPPARRVREEGGKRITLGPDHRIVVELPAEIEVDAKSSAGWDHVEIIDPTPRIPSTNAFGGSPRPLGSAFDIYYHLFEAIWGIGPAPEGFRVVEVEALTWQEG